MCRTLAGIILCENIMPMLNNLQMKPITKNTRNARGYTTESFKQAKALKRSLLLTIGTFVPCGASITYSVLQLEEPGDTDIKKISLLFSAIALPIYLIVLLLKETIDTERDRKKITAMVTELTEGIATDQESTSAPAKQRPPCNTDALVRKIVHAINA